MQALKDSCFFPSLAAAALEAQYSRLDGRALDADKLYLAFKTTLLLSYRMVVDSDIRDIVTKSIETLLEHDDSDLVFAQAKLRQIWKCDHAFDFNYGHMVGLFEGLGMGLMQEREDRVLTSDEMDEVSEIVQSYSMRLREKFLKYKNDPLGP